MEGNSLFISFIAWWYREEITRLLLYLKKGFLVIYDLFSVETCLKTLFAVWKRDRISYASLSIPEMIQAALLNFASRFIGFLVKLTTLISYVAVSIIFLLLSILIIILWCLFPLVIIAMIVLGVIIFFQNG